MDQSRMQRKQMYKENNIACLKRHERYEKAQADMSTKLDKKLLKKTIEDSLSSSDITDDEYIPKPGEYISDSSSEDISHKGKRTKARKVPSINPHKVHVKSQKRRHVTPSCTPDMGKPQEISSKSLPLANTYEVDVQPQKRKRVMFGDSWDTDNPQTSSSGGSEVKVMALKKKADGHRLYNKSYFCLFCSKPYRKMARHLEAKHKDKPEVARVFQFPTGSKERRIQLDLLRNKGNRAHNNKVLQEGQGIVIPRQQSSKPVEAKDYMHCVNCQGYFKRKSMWRHMKRCNLNMNVQNLKPGKSRVQTVCAYAQPVPDGVNEQFWKMVLAMHEDAITNVVRKEKVILKLGEHLFNKHGHDVSKHDYIRQKMRETGRLLLQGKKNGKLNEMVDFFLPVNFPHVIEAVRKVAGLNEETNTFKIPSLALKLGHNLKKIANIFECEGLISGDDNAVHNARVFKQICDTRWSECVSSKALRNLSEAKWNVPQLLPFTEDVKKMHEYLEVQRLMYQTKLKEETSRKLWGELAKVTLCEIILFNRRREGEVSKMPLTAFTLKDTSSTHPDVELALSDLERKLCKHFQRIEIKGKRGRKVPILITPEVQASMVLLTTTRHECGVLDENIFFFARPQAHSHFRGSDVIRQIALNCGANHPEALSSTKLRKHMATMSKVLNLKDNEMDELAEFLGHDIRVHRQYYRLPEGTLQLAKLSKVLIALETGNLSQFKGKNLDEINIDPQEKLCVGSDASDTDDEAMTNAITTSPSSPQSLGWSDGERLLVKEVSVPPQLTEGKLDGEMELVKKISEGKPEVKKCKWTEEEIQAVEKTLMDCISSFKVPGKAECMNCIETSPRVLKLRTWKAVKYYVKNRIDTLKRVSAKQR